MKMNRRNLLKLIQKLNSEKRYYTARECAQLLDMGVSTFKSELKEINAVLKHHGADIRSRSGKGNGYTLVISDDSLFERYLNEILPEQTKNEAPGFTSRDKRVSYLIIRFLGKESFHKSDDLAEQIGLSRTQLSADLALVRKELASYGIELKSVPGYGLHAVGEEDRIRACLGSTLLKNERSHFDLGEEPVQYPHSVLVQIRKILKQVFREMHIRETMAVMDSLGISLVVQYYRVQDRQLIRYSEAAAAEIMAMPEYGLACRIAERIQKQLHAVYEQSELCYMAVHLSTKAIPFLEVVSADADALVSEMLEEAHRLQGIDLSDDDQYRQMLRLHTSDLLKRIRYGTKIHHPLFADVSWQLIEAYDIAAVFASVIDKRLGFLLTPEETGYYAMHTAIALDRKRTVRRNVLLVHAGLRSNTQLLRYSFEKKFHDLTERLDICDVIELPKTDLSQYDAVFSTVDIPAAGKMKKLPIHTISPLIKGSDRQLVRDVLTSDGLEDRLGKYFPQNLFRYAEETAGREELIHAMCMYAESFGLNPEDFESSVRQRARFGHTVYDNAVFLHPLKRMGDRPFIAVTVFDRPIQWDTERVHMILLGSFSQNELYESSRILQALSVFLNDRTMVSDAVSQHSYKTLLNILQRAAKAAR